MPILKRQVNSSSNFALFFLIMTHNSSVNFTFTHFLFWIIWSHQSPNFQTFEYSGEALSNSRSHFPNCKSVFLQTLHYSSVSWSITPLCLFLLKYYILCLNGAHQSATFWDFWVLVLTFNKFLMQILKQQVNSFLNFCITLFCHGLQLFCKF